MRLNLTLSSKGRCTIAAGVLAATLCTFASEGEAQAQIPPTVERDPNWDTVSNITLIIGVASASLMPRVYYSSPDATVGWKGRWHVSALAPIMTMTALTLLVDSPIHDAIQSPKEGCSVENTLDALPDGGCESFGGPSTHAFASWGATGAGLGIFLYDTVEYSDYRFSVPSFIGNVAIPLATSFITSAARSADGRGLGPEGTGQVVAGALPGLGVGLITGLVYSAMQEPDCGYGGYMFCW